jgi:hypothetical protein
MQPSLAAMRLLSKRLNQLRERFDVPAGFAAQRTMTA